MLARPRMDSVVCVSSFLGKNINESCNSLHSFLVSAQKSLNSNLWSVSNCSIVVVVVVVVVVVAVVVVVEGESVNFFIPR